MTGPEKLDFAALRAEMRDGFNRLEDKLDQLSGRVVSLETSRAVAADRESVRSARTITRGQLIASIVAVLGAAYGALRLAHDLRVF